MERRTASTRSEYQYRSVPQYSPYRPATRDSDVYEDRPAANSTAAKATNVGRTLKVLKTPCYGATAVLTTVPLTKINAKLAEGKDFDKRERDLGHIPDLWIRGAKIFGWQYRSLVIVHAAQLTPQWKSRKEDYYMYTSLSPGAGSEDNKFFQEVCRTRVYGDAYIFKAESDAYDMEPDMSDMKIHTSKTPVEKYVHRAAYVDMDIAFAESVANRKGQALEVVKKLALEQEG